MQVDRPMPRQEPSPSHEYDGQKDFVGSLDVGYQHIRERVAAGGPGWQRNRQEHQRS